jgi:ubiquinone/menaquinone biosynthesis C-methylase UbiE
MPLAVAVLHVPEPERVLEIACGDAEGVLFLAREYPGARIRGVDRRGEVVRQATARVGLDPEGRVAFKQAPPSSLPYPDEMFDLVVQARGSLWAAEVVRVLRPGGHLIYVERPGWRLRPWPRPVKRGLARLGFEQIWAESLADGRAAYVGCLRAPGDLVRQ